LLEKYLNGYTSECKQHLYSCSKSVTGLIAGIALEQEGYDLIHTPLCQFFPEYDWSGDERKMKMTFEHILTMTSGLKWQEAGRPWGPGNTNWEMEHSVNWLDFVLNVPSSSEGGKRFSYATGISHLILAIVEKITQKSAIDFAEENLFRPLGIEAHWDLDPQGFPQGGKGLHLKPKDLLKIGRLIHRGGIEGEQQWTYLLWPIWISLVVKNFSRRPYRFK
jgi:CubicO group peptidase (beta-lactamase class C family)